VHSSLSSSSSSSRNLQYACYVSAVWFSLISCNGVGCINEVTRRRARLVLRWATDRRYAVSVCNQPLGPTQPPTLTGTANAYRPSAVSVLCGWEGNHRFAVLQSMWYIHIRAQWSKEHPTYTSVKSTASFTIFSLQSEHTQYYKMDFDAPASIWIPCPPHT